MNLKTVSYELLKSIRGARPQTWLSRRMEYSYNQVYRWESGRTQIQWVEFVRCCEICKVPLKQALKKSTGYHHSPSDVPRLVKHLLIDASSTYIQNKSEFSRFQISHWLAKRSQPSLEHILILIHTIRASLFEFIQELVDASQIEELREELKLRENRKRLVVEHPYVEAVLACLDVEAYRRLPKHRPGFIAKRIGISVDEENLLLSKLEKMGTIRFDRQHFRLQENLMEKWDLRGDPQYSKVLKAYWTKRADQFIQKLEKLTSRNHYGYYVFNIDDEGAEAISEAYIDFFKRIIEIVERPEKAKPTSVRIMNLHIFDPNDPTE